jgi:hypothetical protein
MQKLAPEGVNLHYKGCILHIFKMSRACKKGHLCAFDHDDRPRRMIFQPPWNLPRPWLIPRTLGQNQILPQSSWTMRLPPNK